VGMGKDYTLFARIEGIVQYEKRGRDKKQVSVYSQTI
jgi:large subunit ribosomal protein L27